MADRHLARLAAERQRQELVAEADAEERLAASSSRSRITGTAYSPVAAGSPGPFDRKTPSGWWRRMSSAVAVAGTTVTRQPCVGEAAQDVALGAVIDGDDVEARRVSSVP